jgi:hypothetical protein
MTLSQSERRELASQLEKAREVRVVQLNPTMGSAALGQSARAVADHAATTARTKTVVLIALVR